MDNDEQYDELIPVVLQDLECFLTQKINQNLIFSMIQIKKFARKGQRTQLASTDKKYMPSNSQKNYSDKRSQLSQSKKSRSKESNASFDLLNGAQTLNQIRKNGIKQKIYTQTFQNDNQENSQNGRYSNPYPPKDTQQVSKPTSVNIVPKLVGLVSSDQISDIQPSATNSRHRNKSTFRNYERSIAEVEDDDDEFEDIILNRLQHIQQKVNQMLRQKRSARLHGVRNKSNLSAHLPHYPLQAVGSGANIIYTSQLKTTDFYKHRQPKYNKSVAVMSPRIYTFQNSNNKDYQSSSKKALNSNKPNFTQRISKIHNQYDNNRFTDNQQVYLASQISQIQHKQAIEQEILSQVHQSEMSYSKNKTLGHYRQSEDTIQGQNLQKMNPVENKQGLSSQQQSSAHQLKIINQKLDTTTAFKYIPLSKINPQTLQRNQEKYSVQKTQRQMSNQHKIKIESVNFVPKQKQTKKYIEPHQQRYHRYEPISHQQNYHHSTQFQRESLGRNDQMKSKYRSGKDSGIRSNRLQNSGLRAYTDHGNYQDELGENISISSEKNLYSQIQNLKQMTKRQIANRLKNQNEYEETGKFNNQANFDYRYHQKTQRPKYYNQNPKNGYHRSNEQQQQIIIEGHYPQQKVVRVIKYPNDLRPYGFYPERAQRREYIRYEPGHPPNIYHPSQPIYVVQNNRPQSHHYYEQKIMHRVNPEPYQYQSNEHQSRNFKQQQVKSQRKLSSGSLNSFKSIPYNNRSFTSNHHNNTLTNQYLNEKRSVQYRVEKPQSTSYYTQNQNKSQY